MTTVQLGDAVQLVDTAYPYGGAHGTIIDTVDGGSVLLRLEGGGTVVALADELAPPLTLDSAS